MHINVNYRELIFTAHGALDFVQHLPLVGTPQHLS